MLAARKPFAKVQKELIWPGRIPTGWAYSQLPNKGSYRAAARTAIPMYPIVV